MVILSSADSPLGLRFRAPYGIVKKRALRNSLRSNSPRLGNPFFRNTALKVVLAGYRPKAGKAGSGRKVDCKAGASEVCGRCISDGSANLFNNAPADGEPETRTAGLGREIRLE